MSGDLCFCSFSARTTRSRRVNALTRLTGTVLTTLFLLAGSVRGQLGEPDQHHIRWHQAEQVATSRRLPGLVPVTVASKDAAETERLLPLDEAIRIALRHAEVIRTLGVSSVRGGTGTIYDTAIASTPIDQAISRFDPVFTANSTWRKTEQPLARLNPLAPGGLSIGGSQDGGNEFLARLARRNRLGGEAALDFGNTWNYDNFGNTGRFSRSHRPSLDLSYTQPLLAGGGLAANEAPIVIARLDQSQSYFQFKDQIQNLVRDVVRGYWSLVAARTSLWAREKQVEASKLELDRVEAQREVGLVDIGEVSQARVAYATFRAQLVSARGLLIQSEADLRNLLGMPPEDGQRLVPSTPPTRDRLEFDWNEMVTTAQQYRPDLIELHLILMADQQRLVINRNAAQPTLDAFAIHGWNGVTGRAGDGNRISGRLDDNPAWSLGFNFTVPLSLRESRAAVRSTELTLARDRANIAQGLHATEHLLATTIRNLDLSYEQYEAFRDTRAAATDNLELQIGRRRADQAIFLEVLQAISDWGDAIASEASSLTDYNASLASLERETGTILETHGVTFAEEQYASIGAWGKHFEWDCYPRSLQPQSGPERYEDSGQPAEEAFELRGFDRLEEQPGGGNGEGRVPNVLEVTPPPVLDEQSAVGPSFRLLPASFRQGRLPVLPPAGITAGDTKPGGGQAPQTSQVSDKPHSAAAPKRKFRLRNLWQR